MTLIFMGKQNKIREYIETQEVKYRGFVCKVKIRYLEDTETGLRYTKDEDDQEWWDDMKRQYYEYLSKSIKLSDCLDKLDSLVVVRDKFDNIDKYKAFNKNPLDIDPRFFESEVSNLNYKIETTEKYGEGRTPEEAIKDLYNQLI